MSKCKNTNGSAFMTGTAVEETMYVVEDVGPVPRDAFSLADYLSEDGDVVSIERTSGWWSRLSAPGYLDCTDWQGPYKTEREALIDLAETHDVCPQCWQQCWEQE
jgi:hypothetical protein